MRQRFRPSAYLEVLRGMRLNSLLHFMARVLPGGFSLRPFLHRLRGVKLGDDVWIGDDVYIDEDCPEAIEIQDGAAIATRCTLIAHTKGPGRIIVERQACIGAGCVIVCGSGQTLTIGQGAVVSAGSTVLNDVPAFTLCGAPRIKVYGSITVPYREAQTMEQFRRGIRPTSAKNGEHLAES
jgi:acetyltransferase-like isoleucine patch superfamily enzyme